MAIGLVMVFVGVGEKGFKTVEMRLVGPGLVVSGLSMACVRIVCCLLCDGAGQDDMGGEEHEGAETEQRPNRNGVHEYEENKGEENLILNTQSSNFGDGEEASDRQLASVGGLKENR